MRLLLVIAVTVAQVAGPWLCCCGPLRTAAPVATAAATAPEDDEPACPHCAKSRDAGRPAVTPAPPRTPDCPPLPGRCPCCAVKLLDAVAADTNRDANAIVSAVAFPPSPLTLLAPATVEPPVAAVAALPGLSDAAFLTTEARLYSHHALRC